MPHDTDISRVAFVSLGCAKNLVDSEKMLGTLAASGFELVSDHAEADAVVINTCGFLEASKVESVDAINEAVDRKNKGDLKRVVVAGCLVQRHRARLLQWAPGIDAMIGVFDRDHVVRAVRGEAPQRANLAEASDRPRYWIAGNALQAAKERGQTTTGLTVHGKDGKGIGYFEQVEYGRLIAQLEQYRYQRALCVDIVDEPDSGIDHLAELRKMRLLLESML